MGAVCPGKARAKAHEKETQPEEDLSPEDEASVGELRLLPDQWHGEKTVHLPRHARLIREGFIRECWTAIQYAIRTPRERLEKSGVFREDVLWFMDRARRGGEDNWQFEWCCHTLEALTGTHFDPETFRADLAASLDGCHFGSYSYFEVNRDACGLYHVEIRNCSHGCLRQEVTRDTKAKKKRTILDDIHDGKVEPFDR